MTGRIAVGLVVAVMLALPARGQTSRGDGSQTGDGSTPFTGLAQAPEADMLIGAATTSIPILVPPGRKTITPKLALAYNSNGGPSAYGYGWDLSLPHMQRATKNGTWSCGADLQEYVLTLPGASIACTLGTSGRCVPHTEEAFVKIVDTLSTWDVWDKNGTHYTFGDGLASRDGGATFTVPASTGNYTNNNYTSPRLCSTIGATWPLTSIEDTNGNRLDVRYLRVNNVLYPYDIQYGGTGPLSSSGVPSTLPHQFQIAFQWEGRDDQLENGGEGNGAVLTQRLKEIDVQSTPASGPPVPVRSYLFSYAPDRVGRQTFLESVTLAGSDRTVLLNANGQPAASTFLYHAKTPGFAATPQTVSWPTFRPPSGQVVSGSTAIRWTVQGEGTRRDVMDMNGDGIPDLVDAWPLHDNGHGGCPGSTVDHWDVYLGSKAGFATTPIPWYVPNRGLMCDLRSTTGNTATKTKNATVDLTGDGIPDFVDASSSPWTVYPGTARSPSSPGGTGWGFGAPITWPDTDSQDTYPTHIQVTQTAQIHNSGSDNNWGGSMVTQDLIDMNGDGRLDLVQTPGGDDPDTPMPTQWAVYLNTGSGFRFDGIVGSMFHGLSFTASNSGENGLVYGTFDVNGDGLPDQVLSQHFSGNHNYTGGWCVYLNTGNDLTGDCSLWKLPKVGTWHNLQHARDSDDLHSGAVDRDFFDINGDGLPDLVDSSGWSMTAPVWQVYLNRGDSFEQQPLQWPLAVACDGTQEGGPADTGYIRAGGALSGYHDTFDLDGDGLVDLIDLNFGYFGPNPTICHAADGAWTASGAGVSEHDAGMRPDLLVASQNGIGGTTYLQYRPSTQWDNTGGDSVPDVPFNTWTVTDISRDDGMCGGSCDVGATYFYANGRYDPVGRAFRGFGTVASEALADAGTPHRGTLTYFHQSAAFAGKIQQQWTYDARDPESFLPISRADNTWECADPTNPASATGITIPCPTQPAGNVWVRLKQVQDHTYSNFFEVADRRSVTTNDRWHLCGTTIYGNVQDVSQGDPITGGPVLHTHTEYACKDDANDYLVDRPTHVVVRKTDNVTVLDEKWFAYDGQPAGQLGAQGNVTTTESWLDQSAVGAPPACTNAPSQSGVGCVRTRTGYDAYGNITSVTDALGRLTQTSYDATQIYPATVIQPAPFHSTVSRQYDPGCGVLLSETVPYPPGASGSQPQTVHHYDAFCRPTKTWRPGEGTGGPAHVEHDYTLGAPGTPTAIFTYLREPNHSGGQMLSSVLADALGRVMEQKSESEVDGTPVYVASATLYDRQGRVSQQTVPFIWGSSTYAPFFVYTDPPGGTGTTTFQYDALGRPTLQINPDGTRRQMDFGTAWQTTTIDECASDGHCPGSKTVEMRDALGHVVDHSQYDGTSAFLAGTQFVVDEEGRLQATTQKDSTGNPNSHTTVTTTYDRLGRKVAVDDPDSGPSGTVGHWQYGYDLVGNLVYQNDPKSSQHLEYCYDALNRLTKKFVLLTGDSYAATSCTATTAAASYTYNDTTLNGLGKLAAVTDGAGTYRVLAYDVLGRVLHEERTLAADALHGMAAEGTADMQYAYDQADHLKSLTYPDGEQVSYSYDGAGRVNSLMGFEAYLINLTYDVFGRPRTITHPNGVADQRSYGDPSTNYRLSRIQTTLGSVSPTTLLEYDYVSYDALDRLTTLNDTTPNRPIAALDNGGRYTYDGMGRLISADGPQINDNSYGPFPLDDLTGKDNVALTYSTTQKPHQPLTYAGQTVQHDADGNRSTEPGSPGDPEHVYHFDPEGHLQQIDGNSDGVEEWLTYDYAGRRVAKQTAGMARLYYNSLFEAESDDTVTKYYVAGGLLIASRHENTAQFAAVDGNRAVRVATRSLLEPVAVVLVLRRDVQIGLAAVILLGSAALILVPGRRRRRGAGLTVRPGHALGAALTIVATLPWPIVLLPSAAEGQGCGTTPIAVHYHLDHLGSTHLLTGPTGNVVEYVRYTPYGAVRGRYDAAGTKLPPDERYRREYTGYETDFDSNLEYAGARVYSPLLGMFLTHDPAGEFPNPYTYTNWDPINHSDPGGECLWDLCIAELALIIGIGAAIGATVAGIEAALAGASAGGILRAAAIGSAVGGATAPVGAYVLQPVLAAVIAPVVSAASATASADVVASYILIGSGIGQSAYGLSQGQDVAGGIGLAVAGVGVLLALSQGANVAQQAKTSSGFQPGDATLSELDLHPGDVLGTDQGAYARAIGMLDPTGAIGHTEEVLPDQGGEIQILTSDQRGQVVVGIGDSAVSGRGYVDYRAPSEPYLGGVPGKPPGLTDWVATNATGGGIGRYLGNSDGHLLGSVCSGTCNSALVAGHINTGFAAGSFVTPNGLIRSPALVRVGIVYIP